MESIVINGIEYVPATKPDTQARCVVVVDRGWIFAGDVEEVDGRIRLHNAVWLFRWESVGFDGVLADPKNPKVTLKKLSHVVDIPENTEIFRVPVAKGWGL